MQDKDNLDLLLDSALATYADPGPDAGLEQRVLSALDAERQSGGIRNRQPWLRRWLPWAIAVPLAASLLLWTGIDQFRHAPSIHQQEASQSRSFSSSPDSRSVPGPRQLAPQSLKGHDFRRAENAHQSRRAFAPEGRFSTTAQGQNRVPLPKLDVFPSPHPLTAEEQVLVASAQTRNSAEREALLASQHSPDVPLDIAALDIPPLVAPDDGKQ